MIADDDCSLGAALSAITFASKLKAKRRSLRQRLKRRASTTERVMEAPLELVIPTDMPTDMPTDRSSVAAALVSATSLLQSSACETVLDESVVAALAASAAPLEVQAGSMVFQRGEPALHLYVVASGTFEICGAGGGAEAGQRLLVRGDHVGEEALLGGDVSYAATVGTSFLPPA